MFVLLFIHACPNIEHKPHLSDLPGIHWTMQLLLHQKVIMKLTSLPVFRVHPFKYSLRNGARCCIKLLWFFFSSRKSIPLKETLCFLHIFHHVRMPFLLAPLTFLIWNISIKYFWWLLLLLLSAFCNSNCHQRSQSFWA